jgi:multiple sugar transport system permease protein
MSRAAALRLAAALAVTALMLLPVAWMAATSLRPPAAFLAPSLSLWPAEPTLAHYAGVIEHRLWRHGANSLIVAAGTVVLALAVSVPAAYALGRLGLPRGLDAALLGFVLMVKLAPPMALAVPLMQTLRPLGLANTLAGLVLANQVLAVPMAIWLLIGFVRDVPVAVEEAAMVDGAGPWRRLAEITVPMMAPGIAATAVFVAILSWNEFLFALLMIRSPDLMTLPAYIASRITEDETLWGELSALGVLASLPVVLAVGVIRRALLDEVGAAER